jgi:hypothetical protein
VRVNWKLGVAAAAIAVAASGANAAVINIDVNGTQSNGNIDSFLGTVNGYGLAVTTTSLEDASSAFLSSTVISISTTSTGTVMVEVMDDFSIKAGPTKFDTFASVSQPAESGSVDVAHYVSFDGGITETQLADFDFGSSAGAFSDGAGLASDGTFRLRSLYTIVTGATRDLVNVNGDINAQVVPVPAAGFLLVGGLGALAAVKRRKKS